MTIYCYNIPDQRAKGTKYRIYELWQEESKSVKFGAGIQLTSDERLQTREQILCSNAGLPYGRRVYAL